ncbi:helix-turn-helix domain-containing protein [Prescottella agglutinans]|uniref:XRE-type DNA-binding protein n=1 Tax=Prescottella agglutinans TaxID=1644129 RepID=A0ABT6MI54_9NOCA|nr:XRE family transcriptional regulator [Prescottella agglutinans]MDH6284006.1 putative XRE-type DNA-binding protein [Prescottella agglutinans]
MSRRTPQEKKRLSYARDCRNGYGENDKSSRTSIRLGKRRANRVNRRQADLLLAGATGDVDPVHAEAVEDTARGRRPQRWTKVPDTPLGVHLERKRDMKFRSRLMIAITETIRANGWTPNVAAEHLHVSEASISDLMCGRVHRFSRDALVAMATVLGLTVD